MNFLIIFLFTHLFYSIKWIQFLFHWMAVKFIQFSLLFFAVCVLGLFIQQRVCSFPILIMFFPLSYWFSHFHFVIPFPFLFSFNFHLKNYFHFDSDFKVVILKLIIPIAKCNSMSIPVFFKSYFPFSSNLNLNFHSNIIPLPLQFHYNFNIIFHDFFS